MNGLRACVALVVIGLVWAAPAAAARSSCGVRGRPSPGAGKLEWKPDGRLSVALPGFVGATARDANTLYVAAGSSGNAISAIDLRTGRRLAFRAATPSGTQARHLAVSPTAVYATRTASRTRPTRSLPSTGARARGWARSTSPTSPTAASSTR